MEAETWPEWVKVGQRIFFNSPDMSPHYIGLTYDVGDVVVGIDWADMKALNSVEAIKVEVFLTLLPHTREVGSDNRT